MFKAGVYLNLSEILGSLTEGFKVKENVLEHHQTVDCPPKGHPRLVYSYQFLTSNSNFKTTSNLLNFLFPSILLIL